MTEPTPPDSAIAPTWLRVANATLAAIVAFGFGAAIALVLGGIIGLADLAGAAAIAYLGLMFVVGVVAGFFAARVHFVRGRRWSTRAHVIWTVILLLLCLAVSPQPYTYVEY